MVLKGSMMAASCVGICRNRCPVQKSGHRICGRGMVGGWRLLLTVHAYFCDLFNNVVNTVNCISASGGAMMKKWSWPNLRYYPREAEENHMSLSSLVSTVTTRTKQTSYAPYTKSHIHNPSLRSFIQRIRPSPGLLQNCHNNLFFMVRGS
jgi:hypothetical protein